jgi:inner membrane protein
MKIEINETGKWQHSFTIKMLLLAFMGLVLLIPLEMIKEMISGRQENSENVKKEISSQWAVSQTISGPVLNIPVIIHPSGKGAESYRTSFHILPEKLDVTGDVKTEKRHRSIYQAVVYTSDINFSGEFIIPEYNADEKSELLWDEAYYSMGLSDNRGIRGDVLLKTDSSVIEAVPGLKETDLFSSGITFPVKYDYRNEKITFYLDLKLSGSESIYFIPMGKTTNVSLQSAWNAPGFTGNFLPVDKHISEKGFDSKWLVTNLNRNFPQSWTGNAYKTDSEAFGVNFILQVDHYQKSIRSAKYGILFIALTFLALLFAEISTGIRIHAFHYLELSLGLVLFFSLLNALSEQIGFNAAYFIASSSTILLITFFLKALIRRNSLVMLLTGLLVFLYAFIFVLMSLNDYAYLAGNIGLFILLGITMKLSLKLNFHHEDQ